MRDSRVPLIDPESIPSPLETGALIGAELMSRADYMLYEVPPVRGLHYAEACTAFGLARLARLRGDLDLILALAERYEESRLPPNTVNHVDVNVFGILPLELGMALGELGAEADLGARLIQRGMALADGQWAGTGPDGPCPQARFWIDDVWMIGSLQVQAYRASGRAECIDRAASMAVAYLERLQLPSGLFHHGPAAPHCWGRGNGWVAAGLAEILSALPEGHQGAAPIRRGVELMAQALLRFQDDEGMWGQLVDMPGAWAESSASAMFAYALALGVARGFLPREEFSAAALRAWRALCRRLDERGRLADVCAGTWQEDSIDFYLNRPRVRGDLHGQAPMLWLAWALSLPAWSASGRFKAKPSESAAESPARPYGAADRASARKTAGVQSIGLDDIMQRIKAALRGSAFEMGVGVGRGGILPAYLASRFLDLPLEVLHLNLRDDSHAQVREAPLLLRPLGFSAAGKRVLLCDDVSNTGVTLAKAVALLEGASVRTLVISGKADYSLFGPHDRCIAWPWAD